MSETLKQTNAFDQHVQSSAVLTHVWSVYGLCSRSKDESNNKYKFKSIILDQVNWCNNLTIILRAKTEKSKENPAVADVFASEWDTNNEQIWVKSPSVLIFD